MIVPSEKNKKVLEYYSGLMKALKAQDRNPELEAREDVRQHFTNTCLYCAIFLTDIEKVEEAIRYGANINSNYKDYKHIFNHFGITADLSYNTTT